MYIGLCAGSWVEAIVVDNVAIAELNPTNIATYADFNWDFVYKYKGSSAVAVDPYWVLTAAHVADDGGSGSLSVDEITYNQLEQVYHADADLALVRFDQALPGYYDLFTGSVIPTGTHPELLQVGWGNTGTVSLTSFSNGPGGDGTKRWGSNRADIRTSITVNVGGTAEFVTSDIFLSNFDMGDTAYEAGAGSHDSGGGVFIEEGGEWKLAGTMLYLSGSNPSHNGVIAAETAMYEGWVKSVIPEPSSSLFMGLIFLGYGLKRRLFR